MRTRLVFFGLAVIAAAVVGGTAAATVDGWGKAVKVPGITNRGPDAHVHSVSCAGGACMAGGSYSPRIEDVRAFVVRQRHGRWGHAIAVPGMAHLNKRGDLSEVKSVSCVTAIDCVVGGYYSDSGGHDQAFVVSLKHGHWGHAIEVPGTAALNNSGGNSNAFVRSVSCSAVGACVVGGGYTAHTGNTRAFIIREKHGRWGHAIEMPGTEAWNSSYVADVSCAAVGECAIGGLTLDYSGNAAVFVADEKHGVWTDAEEVPGTAALNAGGDAEKISVSCGAPGECVAGGYYTDGSNHEQSFVVSEVGGVWGDAIEVPGTAALNTGGQSWVDSVSCGAAGACEAGGYYYDDSDHEEGFLVTFKDGEWGDAVGVPGLASMNAGGRAEVDSISCSAAGACAAGGSYEDGSGHLEVFVVRERQGNWGNAVEVPGTAKLSKGDDAELETVSCGRGGGCSAGGFYTDGSSSAQPFVVTGRHVTR